MTDHDYRSLELEKVWRRVYPALQESGSSHPEIERQLVVVVEALNQLGKLAQIQHQQDVIAQCDRDKNQAVRVIAEIRESLRPFRISED